MPFLETLAGQLLIWAGILGAVSTIWLKGVWPILKAVNHVAIRLYKLGEDLPVLQDIAAEFKPNHGKSLKDHVTRLEENLHLVKLDVSAMRMDDKLVAQRVDDIVRRVDKLEAR